MKNKLKAGQEIYVVETNYRGRAQGNEPSKEIIEKVGNKYFYLKGNTRSRFFVETLMHDSGGYSPRYQCYLTLQEILDEREWDSLYSKISSEFSSFGGNKKIPLESLRKINQIIDEAYESTTI